MSKRLLILLLILFFSALVFVPSTPRARAQVTGLVCITASSSATGCPTALPQLGPFTVNQTFTVGVFIQNSQAMGGFDILVKSDFALVRPISAALGNLIATPTSTTICINGLAKATGNCTIIAPNGLGVVEVSTVESSGSNECGGSAPCSGMAFTINYTVVGSTGSTPLVYQIDPGCNISSVSSPANVCVVVATYPDGAALPENIQGATVIQSTSPDFAMAAIPNSITLGSASTAVSNIALTSVNGLSGTVTLSVTPPLGCATCATWSISPSRIQLQSGGTNSSTLTFSSTLSTLPARSQVNVTATLGTTSHAVTIVLTVTRTIPPPDFTIVASPSFLTIPAGSTANSTITLTSLNGFVGTISLTTSMPKCSPPQCSVVDVTPSNVTLAGNGTAQATLVVAAGQTSGFLFIDVDGNGGGLLHAAPVTVDILASSSDFAMSAIPNQQDVAAGSTAFANIVLTSINGTTGTVTLSTPTACVSGQALSCPFWSISPASVQLLPGGNVSATLTFSTTTSTTPMNYGVLVVGSLGAISHSITVGFTVVSPRPDFNLNAYPISQTIPAGTTTVAQVSASAVTFPPPPSFNVTLTASELPPNGPTLTLNPTTVVVSSASGLSTLTIATATTTRPGNYTITVTGRTASFSHSATINVQVLPPATITLTPTSGPVGTKVLVQASGFPVQSSFSEIFASFDDQFITFFFPTTTSFNFTFNVPIAQPGQHTVKVLEPPFILTGYGTVSATAAFQVTPTPNATSFTLSIDIGTIYFPGDTAKAFILITQNGQPASPADLLLTVQLTQPNGSIIVLTTTRLSAGEYSAVFTIPTSSKGVGPIGTYAIIANAHSSSVGDSTAQASFEVKPTWLASNGKSLVTGVTLVGLAGVLGVAWKKGYFKKKEDELFPAA